MCNRIGASCWVALTFWDEGVLSRKFYSVEDPQLVVHSKSKIVEESFVIRRLESAFAKSKIEVVVAGSLDTYLFFDLFNRNIWCLFGVDVVALDIRDEVRDFALTSHILESAVRTLSPDSSYISMSARASF